MTEFSNIPDNKELPEAISPPDPGKRPVTIWRRLYKFLSSYKLAMALLVAILVSCLVGVTIFREEKAGALIFSTLWFNGLLVLLVVNVACCFFPRMWGRKVTLISLGMILFHLSFVVMLGGIVYNSLFYFRGVIRLTEGETLPNADMQSYDLIDQGRFFDVSKLKSEITLIKAHFGYKVSGVDKKIAYEISVGEGNEKKQGITYITQSFDYKGFSYYRDKEGYSVLVVMYDNQGRELYGAYIPLQSLEQKNKSFLYTIGTKYAPASTQFPYAPAKPLIYLQVAYRPSKLKERAGDAFFQVWPLDKVKAEGEKPLAEGKTPVGEKFDAGDYALSVNEIRYWVGIRVGYEPGQPIVLTSMWTGLFGMIITFIGRMRKSRK